MQAQARQVYFLSNGTATHTTPFVDTLKKVHKICDEINRVSDEGNPLPIVICTMGDDDLMKIVSQTCRGWKKFWRLNTISRGSRTAPSIRRFTNLASTRSITP
jgi:hypothetical protein